MGIWTRLWFGGWAILLFAQLVDEGISAMPSDRRFDSFVSQIIFALGVWLILPAIVSGVRAVARPPTRGEAGPPPLTFSEFCGFWDQYRRLRQRLEGQRTEVATQESLLAELEQVRAQVYESLLNSRESRPQEAEYEKLQAWNRARMRLRELRISVKSLEGKVEEYLDQLGLARTET